MSGSFGSRSSSAPGSGGSGALSTARHAAALGRPLGAVPGPVTSMASAGCHRLMREQAATCVTTWEELAELALPIGATLGGRDGGAPGGTPGQEHDDGPGLLDGLDPACARVLDALPAVRAADAASVVRNAGLDERTVRSALGLLELAGRAERVGQRWRRCAA